MSEKLVDKKSFSCMSSDQAIRIFLNRNPSKFTISEISNNLGYHRNTTKNALERMNDVQSIGSGNYKSYYLKSMMDHYREIGKAAKMAFEINNPNKPQELLEHLRTFGYALIKETFQNSITEEYSNKYNHTKLVDNLIHLKLSYPFEDITIINDTDSIKISSTVDFFLSNEIKSNSRLRINPCLCNSNKNDNYLCQLVAGSLQAGLNFVCRMFDSKIIHIECKSTNGCLFEIKTIIPTNEDSTAMDDFL